MLESILIKESNDLTTRCLSDNYFSSHYIGKKTIADIIEALIGAAYLTNSRLYESFRFMKEIGLFGESKFEKFGKVFVEQIEFDKDFYEKY